MSNKAAELLQKHRSKTGVCPKCLNSRESSPCTRCHALKAHSIRVLDALTVATANAAPEVAVLYTYDGGMMELVQFVDGCTVKNPPDRNGPLFEHARNKEAANAALPLPPPSENSDG